MDGIFDQFEQDRSGFKRILDVAVVIAPNNPVCLLAGVAAMPIRRFIALNVFGTLGRILLMRGLGLLFEEQIRDLLEVVARYQRFFTLGSLALVAGYLIYQTIGKRGVVGGLETLEEELGEE
jgi:membrane protein DedA with SNARE-associated domain